MLQPLTLPDAFDPADCDRLRADLARAPRRDGRLVGGQAAPDIRRADLVWIDDLPEAASVMEAMVRLFTRANRHFGFDLTDFAESAQAACYGQDRQRHFDWHSDIGAGALAQRRKLTAVVQLSDPDGYAGGELQVWPDSHPRPARQGQRAGLPQLCAAPRDAGHPGRTLVADAVGARAGVPLAPAFRPAPPSAPPPAAGAAQARRASSRSMKARPSSNWATDSHSSA